VFYIKNHISKFGELATSEEKTFTLKCAECGKDAVIFTIKDNLVSVKHFLNEYDTNKIERFDVERAVESHKPSRLDALLRIGREDGLEVYCPMCNAVYCKDHWRTRTVIDSDGFFDYVEGICPKGHEVTLID